MYKSSERKANSSYSYDGVFGGEKRGGRVEGSVRGVPSCTSNPVSQAVQSIRERAQDGIATREQMRIINYSNIYLF